MRRKVGSLVQKRELRYFANCAARRERDFGEMVLWKLADGKGNVEIIKK